PRSRGRAGGPDRAGERAPRPHRAGHRSPAPDHRPGGPHPRGGGGAGGGGRDAPGAPPPRWLVRRSLDAPAPTPGGHGDHPVRRPSMVLRPIRRRRKTPGWIRFLRLALLLLALTLGWFALLAAVRALPLPPPPPPPRRRRGWGCE